MADETLLELFQELMEEYDDSIDTSDGSKIRVKVIDPFLERIGDSPLDVDLETFLVARLQEEFSDLDVGRYAGVRDLAVRAFAVMLEPFRRELKAIKNAQSLKNYATMTREEVQALLANFFVTMDDGGKASTPVRVYFTSPQTVTVTTLTEFSTGSGLKYYPSTTQSVSSTVMSFQQEGSLYYAEFTVEAAEAGDEYNVEAGDINSVTGIQGAVKVANPYDVTTGLAAETKAEAVARAEESITVRNLSVSRGIKYVLGEAFDFADTIQVIGYRDPEMERDVLTGPATISGVPDTFLVGSGDPDLASGESVHIGGKTDVYVYQQELVEDTLDIENLTDLGIRVMAGTSGYTEQDSSGTVSTFKDDHGNFAKNGVVAGDYLRLGGETGIEKADLVAITAVAATSIDLDGTVTSALSEQTYEIVRFDALGRYIYVSLFDLVAEDADGNAVTNDDGDYVQAVPGDADLSALENGGNYVVKEENVSSANVVLPLVWVKKVEILDPTSLQVDDSYDPIPMADVLYVTNEEAISGGDSSTAASGTVRLYFRDAVNMFAPLQARFLRGARRYRPSLDISGSAQIIGGVLKLVGDFSATILPGYRILHRGALYMVTVTPTYDGGSGRTTVTVREELAADGAVSSFRAYFGQLQADMEQDADSGLYYVDVDIVSLSNGADGNLDAGASFTVTGVTAEGWVLRSLIPAESCSTRDRPYLMFTRWVLDDVDLAEVSTAWAVRVTYASAPDLQDVQDYVDDEDNRIVAEDVLVRHFFPALVRGSFVTDEDFDTDTGLDALQTYVNELDPKENLEVSDMAGVLRDEGATYVRMPITLTVLQQQMDRTWIASIVQDRVSYSRIQHFIADDALTVSSE